MGLLKKQEIKGNIYCLKTLEDGRLAAGDSYSNLIIYKDTFNPEIIIKNNLGQLCNFTQLKNKKIICSFSSDNTLKIINDINNNNEDYNQKMKNAHDSFITKITELKNENFITFSNDCVFKIWKINNFNYYEKIYEFKDSYEISDGIEIKDNELVLYALNSNPQSLVFFNLNKKEKIKTLNDLNLFINWDGERIIKLNNDEVAVAGDKKIYLIDINVFSILHEIDTNCGNLCILKLSNFSFLIGDFDGTISQFIIENKQIKKESYKNNSHGECIVSMTILNDMLISASESKNEIKIWN